MTSIQAVIFDLDGVLADTERVSYLGLCNLVAPADFPWDEYVDLIGVTVEESLAWFQQRFARPESYEELERLTSEAIHDALEAAELPPMPGAAELVHALVELDVPRAVASQSSPRWVRRTLERIGLVDAFPVIVTRSEVERGKPAPDIYLRAAERLGVDPARSIAVEDSMPGIAAAVAAGMSVVQLRAADYAPPLQPGVRYVIGSLAEFDLNWLSG